MIKPIRSRSPEAVQARLRGGAGKHADRRLKRLKTRQTRLQAALKE